MLQGSPTAGFAGGFKRELAFFLGIQCQKSLLLLKKEEGVLCVAAREGTEGGLWPKDLCDVLRTSVIGRGDKASDRMPVPGCSPLGRALEERLWKQ